jgi:hypothetical protein
MHGHELDELVNLLSYLRGRHAESNARDHSKRFDLRHDQ